MIIQPSWVGELLMEWRRGDWAPSSMRMPTAASFVRERDDDDVSNGGYSSIELGAMYAAVEWLQAEHPEHWRVLNRTLRPGAASQIPERLGDHQLLAEVGTLLAKKVDALLA